MKIKKIVVNGRKKLFGNIRISGSKNSSLKLMCAGILLKEGTLTLKNIPNITDMSILLHLISSLGGKFSLDVNTNNLQEGKTIVFNNSSLSDFFAPYSIVSQMRATFNVLGPLLGRFGEAKVSLPGGCVIGKRPVDIHLDALNKMCVDTKIENGYVIAKCQKNKLQGAEINFRFPSVGATENILMAAVLAEGITKINNVAKEPEIIDLANCLNAMGAKISGAGTSTLIIEGVDHLHSAEYTVMGDRIEAATYMIIALITDGELVISGYKFFEELGNVLDILIEIGADITKIDDTTILIKRKQTKLKPIDIMTDVYPGFFTDLQPQIMALLSTIDGYSTIYETVFENRFMHVAEFIRMNANIIVENKKALVNGKVDSFIGANVMASDLRAAAGLLCAGLAAEGTTEISRIYHLERGYEFPMDKLNSCGADISILYEQQ